MYKYRVIVEPKNKKDLDRMFDVLDDILNDPEEYEGKYEYGYFDDKSFYVDFALNMDANTFASSFDSRLVNISYSINEENIMEQIEIKEECKIPGTNIVLEAGDKIYVKENTNFNVTPELERIKQSLKFKPPYGIVIDKSIGQKYQYIKNIYYSAANECLRMQVNKYDVDYYRKLIKDFINDYNDKNIDYKLGFSIDYSNFAILYNFPKRGRETFSIYIWVRE